MYDYVMFIINNEKQFVIYIIETDLEIHKYKSSVREPNDDCGRN